MCIYIKNCYNYILWNTCGNQKENTIKLNKRKRERNQDLSIQKQEKRKDATQRKTGREKIVLQDKQKTVKMAIVNPTVSVINVKRQNPQ